MAPALLLAVLLAALPGPPAQAQTADWGAEGLSALERQDYAAAESAFQKIVEADPANYAAHFNLAFARTQLGKTAEAIAGYERVLELEPGLYEAELNLGVLLLREKRATDALRHLGAAREKKPAEFRPNFYLAEAHYAAGDDPAAEAAFRQAVAADPAAPDARIGLGRALANQGKLDEGLACFEQAAGTDPAYRDFLVEIAARFEERGLDDKAIALYRQFPGKPEIEERLGHLLLKHDRAAEALPYLEAAAARSPTPANRFALATAFVKTKQPARAIPLIELALQAEPDSFDLLMLHGRLLRDQRQFVPAAERFLKAAGVRPQSKEAWGELAGALILGEQYPQAIAALDRLEALGDPPPAVHFFRAIVYDKNKLYQEALAAYERYLAVAGGSRPDEEFKARQRIKVIRKELKR
jgi:tetratricopeptide (TPR) repeat protein